MEKILKEKNSTLQKQFVTRMLIVLIIVLSFSGVIQYIYLSKQVQSNVEMESFKVSTSIEQGLQATNAASKAIEHQLDLKLKLIAERISERLGERQVEEITNEELSAISKEFGIAGITLFKEKNDDILGVKSTSPTDIGFSFKQLLGEQSPGYQSLYNLLHRKEMVQTYETYIDENTVVLPIAPSGSNSVTPTFFKYGYYIADDKDYILNPFIEANEVYHFTQEVGPNTWIETVLESNKNVVEMAVLSPQVYANPALMNDPTSPYKKIEYGEFESEMEKDNQLLVNLAEKPKRTSYIDKQGEHTYYKMFIPTEDGRVIYVGLDYDHLSAPLKNMSLFLLAFSLISLVALFILSTRFFSNIYKNIQVIISQIKKLESGDFTTQSEVKEKGELANLSASANKMTTTLSNVLKDTTKQAEKVQTLSLDLKAEADESVEKVYAISLDLTSKAREDAFEINDFLEMLEEKLSKLPRTDEIDTILTRIGEVRTISSNRAASATEITITLSDLMKSLQDQSVELSEISSKLFGNMYQFKLK
ncbi:methyl-accepting chemotaxis protein [Ureibacillus sp. GCM10028918]|uniref:methyl-accepting chemotaxis protein n=1 Tax=Ureibacillus sp. GCM10028918 TaxID=3273429 RepID=UPI003612DCF8